MTLNCGYLYIDMDDNHIHVFQFSSYILLYMSIQE